MPICVTGMHRSGTSMVARLLNLCGVYLGPSEDLLPPQPDNRAGYWESTRFLGINNAILATLGGGWDLPAALPDDWETSAELQALRRRAETLVAEFREHDRWGWKDPRNSFTLPFWTRVVPDLDVVVCVRNPLDVARSLTSRGLSSRAFGLDLWLAYNDSVLAVVDPERRVVTHYDSYFEDAEAELRRVLDRLALVVSDEEVAAAAAAADASLRHHAQPKEALLEHGVPHDVAALYAKLCAEAGRTTADAPADLAPSSPPERFEGGVRAPTREAALLRARAAVAEARAQARVHDAEARARSAETRAVREAVARTAAEAARNALLASRSFRYTAPLRTIRERFDPGRRIRRDSLGGLLRAAGAGLAAPARAGPRALARRVSAKRDEARLRATPEAEQALLERLLAEDARATTRSAGPSVSIVIVNRDGERHLRRCLAALARTAYENFDVVLVDNGSTDGSLAYAEHVADELPLTIVRNSSNRSFSEANNQGAERASGELVLFLNNDVEPVGTRWLARMVHTLLAQDAAAVGARLVYPRRPGLDNAGDVVHPDLTLQHRGVHFTGGEAIPRPRNLGSGEDPSSATAAATAELVAVTAACMLVRREDFERAGGFADGYVYGSEDVDLCLRLRLGGGRIVYDGGAILWHHEFGTQNAAGRRRKRENRERNRALFVDRWGPTVFRETFADRAAASGAWSSEPLHVAITVTRDDPAAGFGDWYTAHELGAALGALGWRVTYAERYAERWYDLDPSVDVLVVLLDAFDVRRVPLNVVTVAWIRNWTHRWLESPAFDDFDIVLASSTRSKELIEAQSAHVAHLVPLAANPDRFRPTQPDPALAANVVYTGNYWRSPRDAATAVPELAREFDVKVFGRGWDDVAGFADIARGSLPYERLRDAYSSASIVVDDTAGHAKPYGALNARVFEALAAGAFVLTDNDEGVRELFDDEFPTWRDGITLREQARRFLADDEARRRCVERYRAVVLERHTYAHRARQIQEILLSWCRSTRFGIHVGVPSRDEAPSWGDYHFARALQRQLERRGRPTRVHLLPDWGKEHTARADVVLHLFGLSELETRPGQANVLWNISHPALVTPELCERYDVVLVASDAFAAELASRVTGPVLPLHQATDPERFRPDPSGPRNELLLVANSRRVRRQIVDDLAGTPYDLAVYGRGWTQELVDPRYVRGEHVPNAELGRYYSSAAIVLNDHWPDMRELGFLSNRLYDALAAGGFVISDYVEGIEDEFDGAVVTYTGRDDLREKIDRFLADPAARHEHAQRGRAAVLARHTFAHRADALLEIVAPLLEPRAASGARDRLSLAG